MRALRAAFFFLLVILFQQQLPAQKRIADSLFKLLPSATDTARVNLLCELGRAMRRAGDPDSAIACGRLAKRIALKLIDEDPGDPAHFLSLKRALAKSCLTIGTGMLVIARYKEALAALDTVFKLCIEAPNDQTLCDVYNSTGLVYMKQASYPEALQNFYKALPIAERINYLVTIANVHNNIAAILNDQGQWEESLMHHKQALEIREKLKDRYSIGTSLVNIGVVHEMMGHLKVADEYYHRAHDIYKEIGAKREEATCLNNMANIMYRQYKFKEALPLQFESLGIKEELDDKEGMATSYGNIGSIYIQLGDYAGARKYLDMGLQVSKEIGSKEDLEVIYQTYSSLDSATGDFQKRFSDMKMRFIYRDSMLNEENTRKSTEEKLKYEFDKKDAEAKAEQLRKDAIADAEKQQRTLGILFAGGALLLVFVFGVFAYRSNVQKRKANEELAAQKQIIEEKQKEILDSIFYARRIQRSQLPTEFFITRTLERLIRK